jgi:uncharacterized protein YgbK (DUF1537 family)
VPSFESVSRPSYLIVADDLTGACDAAVAFAQRGIETQVHLSETLSGNSEVCAICTESRHRPAEQAARQLQELARKVGTGSGIQIFKKIDSVFRGNTFHEIRSIVDAFPSHLAVIAPAYPALGRITRDGLLYIDDLTGSRTLTVRQGLQSVGLRPHWIAAGIGAPGIANQMNAAQIVFCDATQQSDLDAVVQAAHTLQKPILWIGSAGLAHALASHAFPTVRQRLRTADETQGITLAFIGSDHPVTLRQIESLHDTHPVATWPHESQHAAPSVFLVPIDIAKTSESAIRGAVSNYTPQDVACLFMTGGDTALLVCRALGIEALNLQEEFEPGIPQGAAIGGTFAGCPVILKSGGFGEAEAISRIATRYSQQELAQ